MCYHRATLSAWRAKTSTSAPQAETTGVAARPKRMAESDPIPRSPAVRYSSITHSTNRQQRRRHFEPKYFRGREVDSELKFSWLNHRKIAGLLAIEDTARVDAGLAEDIEDRPVTREAMIHRGNAIAKR
jgi:hypothetical protein